MTSSVFTATQTIASPFRHSRPAAIRTSPLGEWDGHEAVAALQARYSLRGTDVVHALNREQWLAIISDDGARVRVLRAKLQYQFSGGLLDLSDEDGKLIGVVDPVQVVGWCSDSQGSLEASCEARLDRLENEINHNWLVALLQLDELRQMELAAA